MIAEATAEGRVHADMTVELLPRWGEPVRGEFEKRGRILVMAPKH